MGLAVGAPLVGDAVGEGVGGQSVRAAVQHVRGQSVPIPSLSCLSRLSHNTRMSISAQVPLPSASPRPTAASRSEPRVSCAPQCSWGVATNQYS